MNRVFVHGIGAVSPAGWGIANFRNALASGKPCPGSELQRPGSGGPLTVRRVPMPDPKPAFFVHPRMRRTCPIAQYAAGAALEALGKDADAAAAGGFSLGVISCAFSGCVSYSRRFYQETLSDPQTASPLIFPETVFNAPASHLSAILGVSGRNYTLVGDQGEFLMALALGASWLVQRIVDGCIIVAAEELDWLTAGALQLFAPGVCASEGAGAVYLRREHSPLELVCVTKPQLYDRRRGRAGALHSFIWPPHLKGTPNDLLSDGLTGDQAADGTETELWREWPGTRVSPGTILAEGFAASGAWQVVAGIDALPRHISSRAYVAVAGSNEQMVGAVFERVL